MTCPLLDSSFKHVSMLNVLYLLIVAALTNALTLVRHRGAHISYIAVLVRMMTLSYFRLVFVMVLLLLKCLLDELVFKHASNLLLIAVGG